MSVRSSLSWIFLSGGLACCGGDLPAQETSSSTTDSVGQSTGSSSSGTPTSTTDISECGNGLIEPDERCDDGNTKDDDGCDRDCVPSEVIGVTSGHYHTCVVTRNRQVKCWGEGMGGRLGYADEQSVGELTPISSIGFVSLGQEVVTVSAAFANTCAVLADESVRCWGIGDYGINGLQGLENIGDNESPSEVPAVDVGAGSVDISTAPTHVCVLTTTGGVRCWGTNMYGQLGYPGVSTVGDDVTPSAMGDVDIGAKVAQIAASGSSTCVLSDDGRVKCWGSGPLGLGDGVGQQIGDDEPPSSIGWIDLGEKAISISNGGNSACAVTEGQNVRCWGSGMNGLLGYGNTDDIGDDEPVASAGVVPLGERPVAFIGVGVYSSCAVTAGSLVFCWGMGGRGELGYGNTAAIGDDEAPDSQGPVMVGAPLARISVGRESVCGISMGNLWCWGSGDNGKTGHGGYGDIGDDETPAEVGPVAVF